MLNPVGSGFSFPPVGAASPAPSAPRSEAPAAPVLDQVSLGPAPLVVQRQDIQVQEAPAPVAPPPAPVVSAGAPVSLMMEAGVAPERFPLLETRGLTLDKLGSQQGARQTLGGLSSALRSGQPAPAKGYLLVGNSGAGKTSLVRALAGELHQAGIPVIGVDGSEFGTQTRQDGRGHGLDRAHNVFEQAAQRAAESPSKTAVVFLDECEAALHARSTDCTTTAVESNQLMTGFVKEAEAAQQRSDVQIILIGATSLKNAVDLEALKCFPVEVPVNIPADRTERYDVLTALTAKGTYPFGDDKEAVLRDLAACTPGKSPLQLENLLGTATRLCTARGGQTLTRADLREARLEASFGPPKPLNTDEWMFRLTACHELSHAATRHLFTRLATEDNRPDHMPQQVDCITFMPRGTANAAVYLQAAVNPAITLDTMVADITTYYGGKAAEYIFGQGHESQGPGADLSSATNLIQQAVRNYGMGGTLVTSGTGGLNPSPAGQLTEQKLADTCDEMSRSMVHFYREFIGEMAGDITARRGDPNALTINGDDFEAAITKWEDASPERKEQVNRMQDYVRRTVDSLRARQAKIFDPVSNTMIEAPHP